MMKSSAMQNKHWQCPKCSNHQHTVTQISTAGGFLSRLFNLQHNKFSAVTCSKCTFTEFYKTSSNTLSNVLDALAGG